MNKYVMMAMVIATIGLTACGKGPQGDQGIPGTPGAPAPTPTPPVVDEVQQDIDALIDDENDYRLGLGQTALSAGLSCSVVKVASGQCLSSSSTAAGCNSGNVIVTTGTTYTYLYKGNFTQASSSGGDPILLLPPSLRGLFQGQNFKISCSGFIVVRETNWYDFSLNSDDGSILTIDGTQVVNNDNNHGMTLKTGSKFLRRGVKSFSLQYAQTGSGNYGLELTAGGSAIDGKYYAH